MLSLVRGGRTAERAVEWFRSMPSVERAGGTTVKVLYGIQSTGRIAISDDIVLLPFNDLPQSKTRDWLIDQHERANESPSVQGFMAPPSSALVRPGIVEPILVEDPIDRATLPPAIWFTDLNEAARLLTLVRSSMVHRGNIDNEYNLDGAKVPAHEIVEAVALICVEAIRAFLEMGAIPNDWRSIRLR